ncbi:hypothetical protein [Sebaldella sp. S0638]|uniref:hypothetical protein n=1 Tax=Sebaldella sp. S0638 TaxID=2957809 RepID=UPI0020A06044|nr:hypothetical protein [Sebaldella sp. S0638]MCP1225494.1 hypothetical protein [Sebaldella sp. S0638]
MIGILKDDIFEFPQIITTIILLIPLIMMIYGLIQLFHIFIRLLYLIIKELIFLSLVYLEKRIYKGAKFLSKKNKTIYKLIGLRSEEKVKIYTLESMQTGKIQEILQGEFKEYFKIYRSRNEKN